MLLAAPVVLTPAIIRLRRGEQPLGPDPRAGQAADMLRMLSGIAGDRRRQPRAERLSGDGLRAWAQCLDLRGTDCGVHQGRTGLGGDGRHQRAERPAARRRAGTGARHAGCDRRGWQGRSLVAAGTGARRQAHGFRPPHLPGPRSARRRAEGGLAPAWKAGGVGEPPGARRSTSSEAALDAACTRKSPAARSKPMSSSTRPCCSTRSAFPPTALPASLSPDACRAGSPMPASRKRAAG